MELSYIPDLPLPPLLWPSSRGSSTGCYIEVLSLCIHPYLRYVLYRRHRQLDVAAAGTATNSERAMINESVDSDGITHG